MRSAVDLYQKLPSRNAIDKKISKESFLKSGNITPGGMRYFESCFSNATLRYAFRAKSGDLKIVKRTDTEDELHILEINLKSRFIGWYDLQHFAITVIESYPHDMLLILSYQDTYCYMVAKTHNNTINSNKYVVDSLRGSGWFTPDTLTRYSNDDDYYLMPEEALRYKVDRETERNIEAIINNGESVKWIINKIYSVLERDRKAWNYYYRMSGEYINSCIIMERMEMPRMGLNDSDEWDQYPRYNDYSDGDF